MIKGMKMRKKDFIYFASAAVLLAASVQVAYADEVGVKDSAVTESEAVTTQANSTPVIEDKPLVASNNYAAPAPAPVTELPVTSSEGTKADEPKEETKPISEGQTVPSAESTTKPVTGTTAFFSAGSKAPSVRATSTPSRPQGDLSIENNNTNTGTFDAVVRNVVSPTGLKEVLIPSWSVVGGQDDLIWHKASLQSDGSYRATIKASEHKNTLGQYQVHVHYLDQNDKRRYVTDTVVEVQKTSPTGTISIQNNNKDTGTFDVIIKDVYSPKGVRTVQVPTWSDRDGQDDIRWYEATRQSNGDYKVSVKASDHKNSTGKYHIHVYYIQNDGSRVGVGSTTTEVEFRNAHTKTQTGIKNVNSGAGTYTVTVDQAPQGRRIKNIRVAAWSQTHQENLFWYSTTPSGTHTEVQVSVANHQYQSGNYTTHVYVDYVDGGVEGFNLGQTALHPRVTVDQTAFTPRVTNGQRDRVLRAAASLVGARTGSAAHQQLVNDYNSIKPLPVGYEVKMTDDWCDVFVTTVFQREGLSGLIGRECGVERHIQIFKRLGIWNENGASTPKSGDIITFNWDQDYQQNDGFADHIGIVERVENGLIHTIEGNSGVVGTVKRNVYRIGHGNIRGFATPRYK